MNVSVTVAVVAIAADLDTSIGSTAATVVMLNVAMAFTMPLSGAWNARLGPRRLLIAAGAVVLASSILLSLSPNLVVLAIARAGQGAGLAAVVPVSVQASGQLLHGAARARALGWWGAANGLGLAFAPVVGGTIIDAVGWRWVTVPSCALGLLLAVTAAKAFPRWLAHDPGIPLRSLGIVALFTGAAMSAVAAFAAEAWTLGMALVAATVVAWVLLRREVREGGAIAGTQTWLRDRVVRRASTGATLQMVANGIVQVGVPAWLISEGLVDAGEAAVLLLCMTLTMAVMAPLTGRRPSVPFEGRLLRGLAGCTFGLVGLALAATIGPWGLTVPALLVVGLGSGWLLSPSLTAFAHSVAGDNTVALSLYNLLRLGAFGVGGAIAGAAIDARLPATAFLGVASVCATAAVAVAVRTERAPHRGGVSSSERTGGNGDG